VRRALAIASLIVLVLAAAPAVASAQKLFQDFQRDGSINPCKYSDGQLRKGLQGVPPDLQQYAPGFSDQLRAGRGNCGGGAGSGAGGAGGAGGSQQDNGQNGGGVGGGGGPGGGGPNDGKPQIAKPPMPGVPAKSAVAGTPTPKIDAVATGSQVPGWLYLLAVLALAAGAVAVVARRRGWSTQRLNPLRVAMAEAGGRTADAAATTRDRLRRP
jgi:hypothetical protein